jgi:hypothetical protein
MEIFNENLIPQKTFNETIIVDNGSLYNQRIVGGSLSGTGYSLNKLGNNDVEIGDYANNNGIYWNNEARTLGIKGNIVITGDITSSNYSAVAPYAGYKLEYTTGYGYFNQVVINGGTIGGQTVDNVGYVSTPTANSVPTGLAKSASGITTSEDGTISSYITLTWDAISSSTFSHYIIRYKKSSYTYYNYVTTQTNTITIDGLIPNISYDFSIASVNKFGAQSAFSSTLVDTSAKDTTPPATVSNLTASGGIQYVLLNWTSNSETDLSSYNIYRNTTNNSGTSSLIAQVKTNYLVDANLTGGQIYYYWIKALDTSGNISTLFSSVASATPRNANSADTNISNQGWTQTCSFSSTDIDTITWGAGTFTSASGTSYSILTGNTGNMAALTYIYLDIAISTTVYQTTTTATTAVGDGKVLIGVAQNTSAPGSEATFQVFGGNGGVYINGSNLVAGTVTSNEIAANTIVAGNISAGTITTTEIATNTISSSNILNVYASKILIDGATTFLNTWLSYKGTYSAGTTYKKGDQVIYLSNYWNYINSTPSAGNTPSEGVYWTAGSGQITTIDGGLVTANTITTTNLNFVPVESTNVIAKINASGEGITIDADNITISGSTTFASGYNPSTKRRVFTSEPTSPYDIGDLWTTGLVLYKCKTARASGAYSASEWELATGYTDDTTANLKIKTFAQDAIPTSISIGDFWIDTNDGNRLYRAESVGADQITAGEWVVMPDQNKLGGTGSSAVGGSYSTSASGARVLIFPDANTGLQVIDDGGADVLKCIIGGADIGDVIIGNYSGGQGIKYDKSAATTTFQGNITSSTITGGTIQTASGTGERVKIDSSDNTISFYNSSNAVVARLGGGTDIATALRVTLDGTTVVGAKVTGDTANDIGFRYDCSGNIASTGFYVGLSGATNSGTGVNIKHEGNSGNCIYLNSTNGARGMTISNAGNGTSIYISSSAGQSMEFNHSANYKGILLSNSGTEQSLYIENTSTNGSAKEALYISSATSNATGYAAKFYKTGSQSVVDIEQSNNSGDNNIGLRMNIANAGAGIEYAFEFAGSEYIASGTGVSGLTGVIKVLTSDGIGYVPVYNSYS